MMSLNMNRPEKILLLDDDMVTIHLIQSEWSQYRNVIVATQITEGVKLLLDGHFDLVISDVHMFTNDLSSVDCYHVYRKINRRIPYIFLFTDKNYIPKSVLPDPYLVYCPKPLKIDKLNILSKNLLNQGERVKRRQ